MTHHQRNPRIANPSWSHFRRPTDSCCKRLQQPTITMAPRKNGRKRGQTSQRAGAREEKGAREKSLPKRAVRSASSNHKASASQSSTPSRKSSGSTTENEDFERYMAMLIRKVGHPPESESELSPNHAQQIARSARNPSNNNHNNDEDARRRGSNQLPSNRNNPRQENPVENQLTEKEKDESTLAKAMRDLNDPYLKMVVKVLLEDFRARNKHEAQAEAHGAIIPRNLDPSPRQFERQARNFVKKYQVDQVGACIPTAAAAVECQSVISDLTDLDHPSISRRRFRRTHPQQVTPVDVAPQHQLKECDDELPYTIKLPNGKTRTGNRRVRGICKLCKKKTKYYCITCQPSHGSKHFWLCHGRNGSKCHQSHVTNQQNIQALNRQSFVNLVQRL